MRSDETGIFNGRDIPSGTTLEADVCVIGSGPAGTTAAWKLGEVGLKVILLDGSRQLNYPPAGSTNQNYYQASWPDKAKLYDGLAEGIFATNEPKFLTLPTQPTDPPQPWERERVFGGTVTHGGGQCRPFDSVDFEGRVFQGQTIFPKWPITLQELDPFYAEASRSNHLSGDYGTNGANFTARFWERTLQLSDAILPLPGFDVEMYQFMGSPPQGKWKNFATRPWGESQQTIDHFAQVIVNATVLNIAVAGGTASWLEVASMEDYYPSQPMRPVDPKVATRFRVRAQIYILACGAVENARQLLLSKIGDPNVVGHYFMCHPLSRSGIIQTTASYLSTPQYNLMLGNNSQGIPWRDPSFNNNVEGRFITNPQLTRERGIGRCWFWGNNVGDSAQMYFEMAPNYESCVTLNPDRRDPVFGQPQPKIYWRLTATDQRTYETNCQEFKSNIQQSKIKGDISFPSWADTFRQNQWIVNGHHMGTTRMSVNPTEGVVDKDLRVHELRNLYVAGSSVYPSGGISNPTFTIVALSLRLACHVRERLGKPKCEAANVS